MTQTWHKWDPICPAPKGLVRPVPLDPAGVAGPTRGQARGRGWRRTTQGLYVPSDVDAAVVEQRILEMSMLLPELGGATGWAGCRADGATFFDGLMTDGQTELPVPLCIGPLGKRREPKDAVYSRERLLPGELVTRHGIQCVNRFRSLFDEMRYAVSVRESVVAMDMMAAAERISLRQMWGYVDEHPGWTGVPQARAALELASEHSRSPNETRMRMIWRLDAGLPPPLVNRPVFDLNGRLLGYPDLLDPVAGLVGEYDGAEHRKARRHSKDVAREERMRAVGLEYFKITGPDLPDVPLVVARMTSTRSRAKWLSPERRAWTLQPPVGWEQPPTLDQTLELRAVMAAIHEGHERAVTLAAAG